MVWIPTISYILDVFQERLEEKPILMNRGGLESTLDKLQWGIPYHSEPTIWDRAAILYQEIVEKHYFADGNKRIGLLMSILLLEKNGYSFETTNDNAYEFTMQTAQGLKTYEEIKNWFIEKSLKKE